MSKPSHTTRTVDGPAQGCRGALEAGEEGHTCTTYTTLHYPDGRLYHFCDLHPVAPSDQPARNRVVFVQMPDNRGAVGRTYPTPEEAAEAAERLAREGAMIYQDDDGAWVALVR